MVQPLGNPFQSTQPKNHKNSVSSETFVELKDNLLLSDMVKITTTKKHEKELELMETGHRKQMQSVE